MGANVLTLMNAPAFMDGMGKSVNKVKCVVADFYVPYTIHLLMLWEMPSSIYFIICASTKGHVKESVSKSAPPMVMHALHDAVTLLY